MPAWYEMPRETNRFKTWSNLAPYNCQRPGSPINCDGASMKTRSRVSDVRPSETPTVRAHANGRGHRAARDGRLPKTMPMGQFLFEYLHRRGVRHSFGVPGDFALPTFAWLEKSPIESITMTH